MLRLRRRYNDHVVITTNADECRRKTKHYTNGHAPCSVPHNVDGNRGRKKRGVRRLNVMDIITCYCNTVYSFAIFSALVCIQYSLCRSANACHRMSSESEFIRFLFCRSKLRIIFNLLNWKCSMIVLSHYTIAPHCHLILLINSFSWLLKYLTDIWTPYFCASIFLL